MIGDVIREAREFRGLTQVAVGQIGCVSNKTISAIECGRRPVGLDVLGRLADTFDYPRFYMEAAEEVTGGVYSTTWLDGECVDLHRTSVWAKTCEELEEAYEWMKQVDVINNPSKVSEEQRQKIEEALIQALDARTAIDHCVAVLCTSYGLSIKEMFDKHRKKLESRGYIKPRIKRKSAY